MHQFQAEAPESLLAALEHPVRAQVLAILTDRDACAADIAEALGEPVGKVRYHLRALAKSGLIGSKKAEDRRGVREYHWVARTRQVIDDEQLANLPPRQIELVWLYVLRLVFNDASAAMRDKAYLRRKDYVLHRQMPEVDEQGWRELVKAFRTAAAKVDRIGERASRRLAKSGEDPVRTRASLLLFDLGQSPRDSST